MEARIVKGPPPSPSANASDAQVAKNHNELNVTEVLESVLALSKGTAELYILDRLFYF